MCLEESKGRTKGSGSKKKFSIPQDLLEIGQKFYKNNMDRLFDILYPGVSKVGFQIFIIFQNYFQKYGPRYFKNNI